MPRPKLRLVLYNTLTRREEPFTPIEPGHARMYNCGPTVYNHAHVGNMSSYVFADLLRRTLEYAGYRVTQVVNVTDVGHLTEDGAAADSSGEDKMELAAREKHRTPWDIARTYSTRFFEDLEALNIRAAHYCPRATEFIPEMIALTDQLVRNGHAYVVPSGDVYYDVTSFKEYGRLSGNTLESLDAGARVEVRAEKRHPGDFALWKRDPKHVMQWDSPWGRGFPGWHVECSAMAIRFLGETIDIHTGGEDHIFPHHECEIAQSEGATGKPFANVWMHKRFITVDGSKMAKSAANFVTVSDLRAQGFTGREIRYALISTHYRMQSNFTLDVLESARKNLERIDNFVAKLDQDLGPAPGEGSSRVSASGEPPSGDRTQRANLGFLHAAEQHFDDALGADLNVSGALAALFDLIRDGNKRRLVPLEATSVLAWLREIDDVLGFIFWPEEAGRGAAAVAPAAGMTEPQAHELDALVKRREAARAAMDFAEADRLRKELLEKGYLVEDTPVGPKLKKRR